MSDFNLLPDRPIDADKEEDIKFGHKELAETVFDLIHKAEPPFTIGLYGRWGVGKTTISGLVEKKAKEAGIATFFFDVWKYEQDSLRRQFLIELDKELELGLNYKDVLNQSLSIEDPTQAPLIFDWRLLANKMGLIFLVILVVGIFARFFHIASDTYDYFGLASDVFVTVGLSGFLLQAGASAIARVQMSITKYRTDSAEGFEDRFKDALQKINEDKLLIIIDNLDRIEDKKMVEILSDIKTFLSKDGKKQKDKVVFLIPCDNGALRTQLLSTYGSSFDADEFLRKFFNLTFEIPKFINIDLNEYVQALIKETGVKDFENEPNLESVIIYAFRDNPREIKQFINSLTATFLLAEKRKLHIVTQNPAFLAKILVIRQKFQPIYKILTEKALRGIVEFNVDYFERDIFSKLPKGDSQLAQEHISDMRSRFIEFEELTDAINHNQVALFISLRQSDIERSVPDAEKLILALEEGREKDSLEILKGIIASGNKNQIDEILRTYVTKNSSGQTYTNFVITLINTLHETNEVLPKLIDEIATRMPKIEGEQTETIRPKVFANFFYQKVNVQRRKKLREIYVNYISKYDVNNNIPLRSGEYITEHLKSTLENEKEFKDQTQKIRGFMETHLFWFPYISIFDTKERQQKYLTFDAHKRFIASIDVIKSPRQKGELLSTLNYLATLTLSKETKSDALLKIDAFLDQKLINSLDSRKEFIIGVENFLVSNDFTNLDESERTLVIERISSKFTQLFDSEIDDPNHKENTRLIKQDFYYPTFKALTTITPNGQINALFQRMGTFFETAPIELIENKIDDFWLDVITKMPQSVVTKGADYPELFIQKNVFTRLEAPYLEQILTLLVNKVSDHLPDVIDNINLSLINSTNLINKVLPTLTKVHADYLVRWLDSLKKLGVGSNSSQNDQMFRNIKTIKEADSIKAEKINLFIENNKELFNQGQLTELGITEEK